MKTRSAMLVPGAVIVLAFSLAGAAAQNANPPKEFAGRWRVAETQGAPWSPEAKATAELKSARIAFRRGALESRTLFGCSPAQYERLEMEPEGLFEGGLAGDKPAETAAKLGFGAKAVSVRAGCPNKSFDFHLTADGKRLRIAIDNVIYSFRRQ